MHQIKNPDGDVSQPQKNSFMTPHRIEKDNQQLHPKSIGGEHHKTTQIEPLLNLNPQIVK